MKWIHKATIEALDEHQNLLKNDNSSSEAIEKAAEDALELLKLLAANVKDNPNDYGDKLEEVQAMLANYEANGLPTEGSGLS